MRNRRRSPNRRNKSQTPSVQPSWKSHLICQQLSNEILLELEEANFLHARRLARRHQWWRQVISCMQGRDELYGYQGRTAEWARLVEEIRPDYCTADNEPIPGRGEEYGVVMGYRINLAQHHERDLAEPPHFRKSVLSGTAGEPLPPWPCLRTPRSTTNNATGCAR